MSPLKIINKSTKIIDKNTSSLDFISLLLENRGVKSADIDDFLKPPTPEFKKINFAPTVSRLKLAVKNQENILIYGDYDADGLTSTALLWQTLHSLGAKVTPFVPDRHADGYGFKYQTFKKVSKDNHTDYSLLITVDNGIVARDDLAQIRAQNVDVIIVDHHLPSPQFNPRQLGCLLVHSTGLSAAGLAYFLSESLVPKSADIGLAAIGTVADCLPLLDVNRQLVYHGLQSLRLNPSCGIRKLIEVSRIKPDSLSAYDIGYVIAPRLNAVGRLSSPMDALRLLCCQNPKQAVIYAKNISDYNQDRQILQQESLNQVEKKIKNTTDKVLFVYQPSLHPGIIGLVAGRLTEKYYLPSIVVCRSDGVLKGSCRSIPQIDITAALRKLDSGLFIDLGGHAAAAGFSLERKNLISLKKSAIELFNRELSPYQPQPSVTVEAEMKLSAVNLRHCHLLQQLQPFGLGNPEPQFLFKNLRLISKRLLGQANNHLKLKLDDPVTGKIENILARHTSSRDVGGPARLTAPAVGWDAIAFQKGEFDNHLKIGDLIDIVARLDANTWGGKTFPQLIVKEIIISPDSSTPPSSG